MFKHMFIVPLDRLKSSFSSTIVLFIVFFVNTWVEIPFFFVIAQPSLFIVTHEAVKISDVSVKTSVAVFTRPQSSFLSGQCIPRSEILFIIIIYDSIGPVQ